MDEKVTKIGAKGKDRAIGKISKPWIIYWKYAYEMCQLKWQGDDKKWRGEPLTKFKSLKSSSL